MSVPAVSIIMNVRNGAPFLREALDSVMAQTFTDWELVVWDDCSTDGSAQVVAEYQDPRIRYYLSAEDTPLGPAREAAIARARGTWLAFLDQDDIWLPEKLARQLETVAEDREGRVGMVYGRAMVFYPDGREHDFDSSHEFASLPEGNLFEELFRASCFVAISAAIFRRSTVQQLGPIPADYLLISDYYLFVAISRVAEVRAVQAVVCRYRRHAISLSRARYQAMHEEALRLVDQWQDQISADLAQRARCRHQTAIAMIQLQRRGSFSAGLVRLLRHGSLFYVASRPIVRAIRIVRRWFQPAPGTAGIAVPRQVPAHRDVLPAGVTVSIIVVNWNTIGLLRECIRSVYQWMELPASAWELVVVDNHSSDGSAAMVAAEFPDVRLLASHENLGFARGNNEAFRHCQGRYIYLLNPDAYLRDPAVDRMIDILEAFPRAGVLGSRLLNTDLSLQRWTAGAAPGLRNILCHFLFVYRILPPALLPQSLFLEIEPEKEAEVGWVSGASMLLRREALGNRIFDEDFFMYGEDMDLCRRLISQGWQVIYTPRVEVVHHGGRSIDAQSPEVQLYKLINLRKVFAATRNGWALLAFDLMIAAGYLVRSAAFSAAALVRPRRGYAFRAQRSRQFMVEALRSIVRAN